MQSDFKNLIPVLALWSLLLLPWLFGRGIFADGLYYGTMSRNWCFEGAGFWDFYLSKNLMNPFFSHPPLAFWLQGSLFCIFGDQWWLDRFYSILMWCGSAFGIFSIWRLYNPKSSAWLPLLLWLCFPTTAWAYNNNVLENSLALFSTWAVFFMLSAQGQDKYSFLKLSLSGLLVFLATMCKGPVGLFPLILPFIHLLIYDKLRIKNLAYAFIPLCSFVFALSITLSNQEAFNYLKSYYEIQIGGSLGLSDRSGQFKILYQLFVEIVPPLILILGSVVYQNKVFGLKKEACLFLLIALSASLPIMISPKQMGFYILPSLPFWALGLAMIAKNIRFTVNFMFFRIIKYGTFIMFLCAFGLMFYNFDRSVRDFELLKDVREICKSIPKGSKAGMDPELSENWQLLGYLARTGNLSLYSVGHGEYSFHIGKAEGNAISGCSAVYKGKEVVLYSCPKPE